MLAGPGFARNKAKLDGERAITSGIDVDADLAIGGIVDRIAKFSLAIGDIASLGEVRDVGSEGVIFIAFANGDDKGIAKPIFRPESLCTALGLPKSGGISFEELALSGCNLSDDTKTFFLKVNGYRKTFSELQAESGLEVNQLLTILTFKLYLKMIYSENCYQNISIKNLKKFMFKL